MVFPLIPIAAAGIISGAGGLAAGYALNENEEPITKKQARDAGNTIFPAAESAPLSFNGQSYTYNPDNSLSSNQQNVNHAAYETFQPVTNYSPQITTQYPDYTVIINSPDAVASTKKSISSAQETNQTPEWYQPTTNTPSYSQDKSNTSGIDPMLFVYVALILGAAWVIGGVVTKR